MRYSRRSVPPSGRKLVERDLQWGHAAWPSEPRGLTQLHAIVKESVAYIYYLEHSHRRTYLAGIQQREVSAAGRTPMMNINLKWKVLSDRMYVYTPTGKPKEYLNTLLFHRATRRNRKDPYEEKRYRGANIDAVTGYWKQCGSWMAQYKGYVEPYTFNSKKLLKALYHKEGATQSEVDCFLENYAKKWQTREGTYQIKRQRLKSDVRDPSERMVAGTDMADI